MKSLSFLKLAGAAGIALGGAVASAQVTTIDPNSAATAPVVVASTTTTTPPLRLWPLPV